MCQAADQINRHIIAVSAGFFLFLTVPLPKTQLLKCNQWRKKKKKSSKALLLESFIPVLWLETAREFLNKANSIIQLNFYLAPSTGISIELPIVIH